MADATLINHALSYGFRIPKDRLYLADAGFGSRQGILVPFLSVRYHLQDFRDADEKPTDAKELYNLRHSRHRMVVEQAFSLLKRKWKIVRVSAPEYTIQDQIGFVYAVTALHNFILTFENGEEEAVEDPRVLQLAHARARREIRGREVRQLRCRIARGMWKQYKLYLKRNRR